MLVSSHRLWPLLTTEHIWTTFCRAVATILVGAALVASTAALAVEERMNPSAEEAQELYGTLKNGLKYAIVKSDSHGGTVKLTLHVATGLDNDPAGRYGLSHVLEHVLGLYFRDTSPPKLLHEIIAERGWDVTTTAYSGANSTKYRHVVPLSDLQYGLQSLRMIASGAIITEEQLDSQKRSVNLEAKRAPHAESLQTIRSLVSGKPFGKDRIQSVASISLKELYKYYTTWYNPENETILVYGDVNLLSTKNQIERIFGDIRKNPDKPKLSPRPKFSSNTLSYYRPELALTRVHLDLGAFLEDPSDGGSRDVLFQSLANELAVRRSELQAQNMEVVVSLGSRLRSDFYVGKGKGLELAIATDSDQLEHAAGMMAEIMASAISGLKNREHYEALLGELANSRVPSDPEAIDDIKEKSYLAKALRSGAAESGQSSGDASKTITSLEASEVIQYGMKILDGDNVMVAIAGPDVSLGNPAKADNFRELFLKAFLASMSGISANQTAQQGPSLSAFSTRMGLLEYQYIPQARDFSIAAVADRPVVNLSAAHASKLGSLEELARLKDNVMRNEGYCAPATRLFDTAKIEISSSGPAEKFASISCGFALSIGIPQLDAASVNALRWRQAIRDDFDRGLTAAFSKWRDAYLNDGVVLDLESLRRVDELKTQRQVDSLWAATFLDSRVTRIKASGPVPPEMVEALFGEGEKFSAKTARSTANPEAKNLVSSRFPKIFHYKDDDQAAHVSISLVNNSALTHQQVKLFEELWPIIDDRMFARIRYVEDSTYLLSPSTRYYDRSQQIAVSLDFTTETSFVKSVERVVWDEFDKLRQNGLTPSELRILSSRFDGCSQFGTEKIDAGSAEDAKIRCMSAELSAILAGFSRDQIAIIVVGHNRV